MIHMSGNRAPWDDRADEDAYCCMGAANYGAAGCTCWEAIYDPPRQSRKLREDLPTPEREAMCADCAFRPGSPERTEGTGREIDVSDVATGHGIFWCHQGGMQRIVRYEHPDGRVHVPPVDNYDPPIKDDRPYLSDGMPASVCAGYAAHRRAAGLDIPKVGP